MRREAASRPFCGSGGGEGHERRGHRLPRAGRGRDPEKIWESRGPRTRAPLLGGCVRGGGFFLAAREIDGRGYAPALVIAGRCGQSERAAPGADAGGGSRRVFLGVYRRSGKDGNAGVGGMWRNRRRLGGVLGFEVVERWVIGLGYCARDNGSFSGLANRFFVPLRFKS